MAIALTPMLGWMNALADATRVRLLRALERHELTVAELCAVLQLPQSTVSRHLKVLGDEGWVESRREGTSRLYRMPPGGPNGGGRKLWGLLREDIGGMANVAQDDRRLTAVLAERRTRSQEFFSSAAGKWDKLRSELFGERFDLLGLLGLLDETWTIGDLGCGTAQLTHAVAPFVKRVIAVDESPVMLRHAEQRLKGVENIHLRRGELSALPIDDDELDAAVMCMVLHHIPEPTQVLREAARILKPGGKLLIIDILKHDREEYRQQMGHVWLGFEPQQLTHWLREADFDPPRTHAFPPDANAKGPTIFAAVARKGVGT
jgi:ubiquinone/menaquinone biosynthesis C-methylase UbiE